ncbi:MAG: GNAT family N-acetyltransferase [Chloroflexota bacterium]
MTATILVNTPAKTGSIRPLNPLRDLPSIADLIELCFSSTLDSDGRSYIEQMRRSGRDSIFLNWAPRVMETVSLPLSGFVWENNGKVVGNVSLIPFSSRGKKIYLIANVATHPDFRRMGIARQLTIAAMEKAREKKASAIWLHVRDDNPGAIKLYEELGFAERSKRTSWEAAQDIPPLDLANRNIKITSRETRDWPVHRVWLSRSYPPSIDWYYSQTWELFKPGILNFIYRLMLEVNTYQWAGHRGESLKAVLACQRTGRGDQLWLSVSPDPDQELVTALLKYGRRYLNPSRSLQLDFPASSLDDAIRAAGLTAQRTLVWMEAPGIATF